MHVLITWGTKHGATADIAEEIGHVLRERGHDVHARPAQTAPSTRGFHAVIAGSAVHGNRWLKPARQFIEHHLHSLRRMPTWLFSNGRDTREAQTLMARIGALDHVTLAPDEHAAITGWASRIADALPTARPRVTEPLHGRAIHRLVEYGTAGWAITTLLTALALGMASAHEAVITHVISAPLVFALLGSRYQGADGARSPATAAIVWTLMVGVLDVLLVSQLIRPQYVFGIFAPMLLILIASWTAGAVRRRAETVPSQPPGAFQYPAHAAPQR